MDGWRARLGLLVPADNSVIEPELGELLPSGVTAHTIRLTTTQRSKMPGDAVQRSPALLQLRADVAGYACAETSFLGGVDTNAWIAEGVLERTGIPTITASGAVLAALAAFGATRIAVACPYPAASVEALVAFLEIHGHHVVRVESRDLVSPAGGIREWVETNAQPPSTAAALGRKADHPAAEAVLISGTNWRTVPVIEPLERDLGKPVISSNSTLLWSLLARAGVRARVPALGALTHMATT